MVVPRGQMLEAIKRGDLAKIKRLVQTHGLYSTPKSSKGCFLLAEALRNDQRDIAKLLLDHGATATCYSSAIVYRYSPLHLACTRGYYDIVELCIQRGADVNQRDRDRQTPLDYTTDSATARLLLQNGARVQSESGHNQLFAKLRSLISRLSDSEALEWFRLIDEYGGWRDIVDQSETCFDLVTHASNRILHELLKRGFSAKAKSRRGSYLIHDCARRGGVGGLKLLVDFGADLKARDGNGNSALHTNCKIYDSDKCIEELLNRHGLNPNMHNNRGETPLHVATASRNLNIVKILIDWGADVSARTNEGLTALHIAADYQYSEDDDHESEIELIRFLLRKSPNVNTADASGKTPLHYAIFDRDTVELLVKNGADINAEDLRGRTPLYLAIESDETDAVDLLLDRGIDLSARFRDGTTPLHLAARGGEDTLRLLCDRARRLAIDIDCLDANGQTPLFSALLYSYRDYFNAELLLEMGSNLDHIYWIDKERSREWFSVGPYMEDYWGYSSEQVLQLATKLALADLLPESVAPKESRYVSDVIEYNEELEQLEECMILGSMSLYDFLHNENRLTAKAICQVRHDLDTILADFPNYRGIIESKMKIDLAYAAALRVAMVRLGSYTCRSPLLQHLIIPKGIIRQILLFFTHRDLNILNGELRNIPN